MIDSRRRWVGTVLACVVVAALAGGLPGTGTPGLQAVVRRFAQLPAPAVAARATAVGAPVAAGRPNIVFVLTDDLSWNLVRYMPHVRQMMRQGTTFTDYTVTDSLCCPSRASILTGEFPHDTGVHSNAYPDGGYYRFQDDGLAHHTFAVSLSRTGYATGFIGKYLNQYELNDVHAGDTSPSDHAADFANPALTQRPDYAPPGWSNWAGADEYGYAGYDYSLALPHEIAHFGSRPQDYTTGVFARLGRAFVAGALDAGRPFALEIASFAPHHPFVPAPVDRGRFPGLRLPRGGAYDRASVDPARWLAGHGPLTRRAARRLDRDYRLRVESVQAVDRMIGALRQQLAAAGALRNTYVVFSSDNGFHMGDYRLDEGKQTPYDTDIRVPLIVTGPGVPASTTNPAVVENVDLAPTFDAIGGATVPASVDGASMLPLWHGVEVPWRTVALVEHHRPVYAPTDPDSQRPRQGTPPTYEALRTATWTYVHYADGERAFFDRTQDPAELDNRWSSLPAARRTRLESMLRALRSCHGAVSCWAAGRPGVTTLASPVAGPG